MPDNIPAVPEGFEIASLQGDAWQGVLAANDSFKENSVALNTKGPMDAIEQLVNAQSLLGKDRLPSPNDEWTEDQWGAHFKALGRPEAAADYKYENAPEIPGFEVSEEFTTEVNDALFAAGLNGKQHTAVMDTFFNWLKKSSEGTETAAVARNTATMDAIRKEHGDQTDGLLQQAQNTIAEFGSPEFSSFLEESGLGSNPGFVSMMINVSKEFGDDTAVGSTIRNNLNPTNAALGRIADLKADDSFVKKLHNATAPGHKDAVTMWQDLHKKAYPGTTAR